VLLLVLLPPSVRSDVTVTRAGGALLFFSRADAISGVGIHYFWRDELFLVLESDAEFVFSGELFLWDAAKPLE
jgi:hypothetical protein